MPSLDRIDEVYVLDLGPDRNVINPQWLDAVSTALDEVVRSDPPRGLVTTGSGEFFSFGLDLRYGSTLSRAAACSPSRTTTGS